MYVSGGVGGRGGPWAAAGAGGAAGRGGADVDRVDADPRRHPEQDRGAPSVPSRACQTNCTRFYGCSSSVSFITNRSWCAHFVSEFLQRLCGCSSSVSPTRPWRRPSPTSRTRSWCAEPPRARRNAGAMRRDKALLEPPRTERNKGRGATKHHCLRVKRGATRRDGTSVREAQQGAVAVARCAGSGRAPSALRAKRGPLSVVRARARVRAWSGGSAFGASLDHWRIFSTRVKPSPRWARTGRASTWRARGSSRRTRPTPSSCSTRPSSAPRYRSVSARALPANYYIKYYP